tara:strand:+ start:184 stop:306 length:123 start_codon:yes stop_codon:yes gene_type:complete
MNGHKKQKLYKYNKGGLVKKKIARGCGKIMDDRRKMTKYS